MTKEIVHRLKDVYKEECGSLNTLSERIGVSLDTLKNIFSRGSKPSLDIILKFVEYFPKYSVEWLLRGEGEKYRGDLNENSHALIESDIPPFELNNVDVLNVDSFLRIINNLTDYVSKSGEAEKVRANAELLRAEAELKNAEAQKYNSLNMKMMLDLIMEKKKSFTKKEDEKLDEGER